MKHGEQYVTTIINTIMSEPTLWESCAIFLSWDDWGGFYDHVNPPNLIPSVTGSAFPHS